MMNTLLTYLRLKMEVLRPLKLQKSAKSATAAFWLKLPTFSKTAFLSNCLQMIVNANNATILCQLGTRTIHFYHKTLGY